MKRTTLLGATLLAFAALAVAEEPSPKSGGKGRVDEVELVKTLMAARAKYQETLERVRAYYISSGDVERARWAESELLQYHRIPKHPMRLDLDVPPPTLKAARNIPEANDMYRQAMKYKDEGWGDDYVLNQKRAELLLQRLLTNYPQSDKIGDAAYQLGDLYESRAYKQYRRAAYYFERCFQWNPTTQLDARLRAARLYDRQLIERRRARELYQEVVTHETDPRRIEEAKRRLTELSNIR